MLDQCKITKTARWHGEKDTGWNFTDGRNNFNSWKDKQRTISKTEKLARDGKLELARLKKENFKLKRKADEYEAEVTDESFNSLPSQQELLPSSQEDTPAKKQKISDTDMEKTFVPTEEEKK